MEQLTFEGGCVGPVWHPRGDTIAYLNNSKGVHLFNLLNRENKAISVNDSGGPQSWSPGGSKLMGLRFNSGGYFPVWNLLDNEVEIINPFPGRDKQTPQYSPDGKKILFEVWGNTSSEHSIYIMDSDGSNLQQILNDKSDSKPNKALRPGSVLFQNPSWYPDGKHICYQHIELTYSESGFSGLVAEGYTTVYKLNIEKALQLNRSR